MKDIRDLILKISGIPDPRKDKQIIADAVKEFCGFDIDLKKIDFSNDTLKLNISSIEKNSVFMYQQKILERIRGKTKERIIKRIV